MDLLIRIDASIIILSLHIKKKNRLSHLFKSFVCPSTELGIP